MPRDGQVGGSGINRHRRFSFACGSFKGGGRMYIRPILTCIAKVKNLLKHDKAGDIRVRPA